MCFVSREFQFGVEAALHSVLGVHTILAPDRGKLMSEATVGGCLVVVWCQHKIQILTPTPQPHLSCRVSGKIGKLEW